MTSALNRRSAQRPRATSNVPDGTTEGAGRRPAGDRTERRRCVIPHGSPSEAERCLPALPDVSGRVDPRDLGHALWAPGGFGPATGRRRWSSAPVSTRAGDRGGAAGPGALSLWGSVRSCPASSSDAGSPSGNGTFRALHPLPAGWRSPCQDGLSEAWSGGVAVHLTAMAFRVTAIAQTTPVPASQDWKTIISWLLGLPVAVAAVAGTIYALPKARRENRKLDLEILEKERALGLAHESNNPAESPGSLLSRSSRIGERWIWSCASSCCRSCCRPGDS